MSTQFIQVELKSKLASGSILNTLNNLNYEINEKGEGKDYELSQQRYAQLIQKYVRGWIKRSKYTGLKIASNKLKHSNNKVYH